RQNILHRDIKPVNILLADGQAVLADFGIARAIRSAVEGRLTQTGLTLGTPAYMSPEQSNADQELDERADVYSLACVLYEMLVGEPPFTGATPQVLIAKRLSSPPPSIRLIRPTVPPSVEDALLRGLAPVPADRFATAGEFRTTLGACDAAHPGSVSEVARRQPSRRRLTALFTLAVLAVLASALWALGDRVRGGSPRTVAILPLSNASGNPEHAYLAEGLTDALIDDLTRMGQVRVISRASVMRYASGGMGGGMASSAMASSGMPGAMKPSAAMSGAATPAAEMPASGMATSRPASPTSAPKSLSEIASELGADLLVQGSLARAGDSVRVSATAVDAGTQTEIWTGEFTRHLRELFALQQDLVTAIVRVSARNRSPSPPGPLARRPVNPAAHEAHLKGSYYQAHWRLPEAITAFRRAVELDPDYAQAYAGLARAYYFLAFFGEIPPGEALGAMQRAANAALQRDTLLAEAHGQLALVKMLHEWDWDGAERQFRRALELSPANAQIRHDYAHFLLAQGRQRESLRQTEQAVALDPVNPMLTSCLGWHSLFDARHGEAIAYAAEAHTMMPDDWAQVVIGWALIGQGQLDSAVTAFREATRLSGSAFATAALGHGLAVAGRKPEARAVLAGLLARAQREYVSAYDIATVYAGLGEVDETFTWLRRAADERSTFIVHLGWDARFAQVSADPRYREMIERRLALPIPVRVVSANEQAQ
ncbi:MAG TPA: tetratricopeptide repeat protein, partial [Gemmatimonadaceae bacterium]|nr:tetratricopeptide repeat protein [Gemmatimonadaceae bacterium]